VAGIVWSCCTPLPRQAAAPPTGDARGTREPGGAACLNRPACVIFKRLYANDNLDVDLPSTVYALDSTAIDLCLSALLLRVLPISVVNTASLRRMRGRRSVAS